MTLILFSININAQLPNLNLVASLNENNVALSWTYSSYGNECVRDGDVCCIGQDCTVGTIICASGYGAVFKSCDNSCSPVFECEKIICNPDWQCTEWSSCNNNKQTRICSDLNNCNTKENKPAEIQKCINNAYGSSATGLIVRDTIAKTKNLITSNSILDIFSNIGNSFKKLFEQKAVAVKLRTPYQFEIYRNGILLDSGPEEQFCKDKDRGIGKCRYTDLNLNPGKYEYYIRIFEDKSDFKDSNEVSVTIEAKNITQQVDAYITLATTKDYYRQDEKIELTDPPQADNNKFLQGTAISKDYVNIKPGGYIIQFKQDPILVEKTKLEKQLEDLKLKSINYKENYENANVNVINFIYKYPTKQINKALYSKSESDYNKLQNSIDEEFSNYKTEFKKEFDNNLQEVKKELNLDENKITRKFDGDLFNGIVLNINEDEANKIKKLNSVFDVFPNEAVHVILDKSVPVIKGDIVRKDLGLTGENITVAVIDTGIDSRHESLDDLDDDPTTNDPKVIGFKDFVNFRQTSYDNHFHGTHVSGICCGTGGKDKIYVGVAPKAKLVGVKVLDKFGSGTYDQVIAGMEWVAQNKDKYNIKIASMSLGGRAQLKNDPMEYAANALVDYGITLVVAAGNSGPSPKTIASPGSAEKAITVGAIDNNLDIAGFSSRGPTLDGRIKPDVTAPGVNINAPKWDTINEYWRLSGTSMATPHVSGAIALIYQARPEFNDKQVKELLYGSALDRGEIGRDNTYGYGVVDLLEAMTKLNQPNHEISVYDIIPDKKFAQLNENINLKVLIKNYGSSEENNLEVSLYINDILKNSYNINQLLSGEIKEINFNYMTIDSGDNKIKVQIQTIPGELFKSNNELVRTLKVLEKIKDRINAVVLDSWGTDYARYSIFDELNNGWYNYGEDLVNIDYKTLNKEDITYEDIAATKADVLIVSDAWDNSQYTGNNWQFRDNEIDAIKRYVEEGHGIIATSGTFSELVPNNMKLAPLFGMDQSKIGFWADGWSQQMKRLYKDNSIFNRINDDIYYTPTYFNNNDLEQNKTQNGNILAISTDDKAKIFFNNENANNIYLSSMEELSLGEGYLNNKLIFYNSIVTASQNISKSDYDLRLFDLENNKLVYQGDNASVKAKIKNLGITQNNVNVDLVVNNKTKDSVLLNELKQGDIINLTFNYQPDLGVNSISIYTDSSKEKNNYDNSLYGKSSSPRAVIKNLNDYGLDTNNDGLYNYIILNITLDTIEEGYYYLSGTMYSNFGVLLSNGYSNGIYLDKGINFLTLTFDAIDISKFSLNGPYKIKEIYVRSSFGEDEYDYYKEYLTKDYKYNELQLSSDLIIKTAGSLGKFILNETSSISLEISNIGSEVSYNSTFEVYQEDNKILYKNLPNINPQEEISESFNYKPSKLGYSNLIFAVNSSNDFKQENNLYYLYHFVIPNGPDLVGQINYDGRKFINVENNIHATIQNVGVGPITDSKASLYLVQEYYLNGSLKENITLIQEENTGSFAVDQIKDIDFKWTPNSLGYKKLRLVIESPEDLNQDNNINDFYIDIIYDAPDIYPTLGSDYLWIVNKPSEINLYVYNFGTKDANNVTTNLYLEEKDNRTLVFNKNYDKIMVNDFKKEQISYNIDKIGQYYLSFEVDSQDLNESKDNNIYRIYIEVIEDKADILINNVIRDYNKNFLVNESVNISASIYNRGTKTANDVSLNIYVNDELFSNILIGDLNSKEYKDVLFKLSSDKLGYNNILLILNSSSEENTDNNQYFGNVHIVPKSLLMNLETKQISGYLLINIEKYNYGTNNWEFYRKIVDDIIDKGSYGNNLRIIKPGEYLALDKIFNPYNVKINEYGTYRVYVAFVDNDKNVILDKHGKKLESYYDFYL